MIDPCSASYAVLGAARATGVDYGLALRWVDSARNLQPDWVQSLRRARAIAAECKRLHGDEASRKFLRMITAAVEEGRIYAPQLLTWGSRRP